MNIFEMQTKRTEMGLIETILTELNMCVEILHQYQIRLLQLETQKTQIVQFQRVCDDAILPGYAHPGDSGMDVFWTGAIQGHEKEYTVYELLSLECICCQSGWKAQIPEGYELQIRPKSGLALKHRLTVLNTPGTIDSSYRGEIGVILMNLGSESVTIQKGQKIAQLVLCPVIKTDVQEVDSLDETSRNDGGFGSTGV